MPWLIKLTFALSLLALVAATTRASAFDMTGDNEDRYAHPRSVDEYRDIVSEEADPYGMCRSAEHLPDCLAEINGVDVEVIKKALDGGLRWAGNSEVPVTVLNHTSTQNH